MCNWTLSSFDPSKALAKGCSATPLALSSEQTLPSVNLLILPSLQSAQAENFLYNQVLLPFILTVLPSISFLLHFTISSRKELGSTFHRLLRNLLTLDTQVFLLINSSFCKTVGCNPLSFLPLYDKDHFPLFSNNIFLISFWGLTNTAFMFSFYQHSMYDDLGIAWNG